MLMHLNKVAICMCVHRVGSVA